MLFCIDFLFFTMRHIFFVRVWRSRRACITTQSSLTASIFYVTFTLLHQLPLSQSFSYSIQNATEHRTVSDILCVFVCVCRFPHEHSFRSDTDSHTDSHSLSCCDNDYWYANFIDN